jgi:WD40 repeat protein
MRQRAADYAGSPARTSPSWGRQGATWATKQLAKLGRWLGRQWDGFAAWWGAAPSADLVRREELKELQAYLDRNTDEQLLLRDSRRWEEKAGDANRALLLIAVLLAVVTGLMTWKAITAAVDESNHRRNAEIQGNISDALRTLPTNPEESVVTAGEAVKRAKKAHLSDETLLRAEDTLRQAEQFSRLIWHKPGDATIWNIAFSPRGGRLAVVGEVVMEGGKNPSKGMTQLWERSPDGSPFGFNGDTLSFPLDPKQLNDATLFEWGGREYLVTACDDGNARLWDLSSKTSPSEPPVIYPHGKDVQVWTVAVSPDGKGPRHLATAGIDGFVRIWKVPGEQEPKPEMEWQAHNKQIMKVAYYPGSELLATASVDGTAKLWDTSSGTQVHCFRGHRGWVYSVAFNHDGTRLATASEDGTVIVWNTNKQALPSVFPASIVGLTAWLGGQGPFLAVPASRLGTTGFGEELFRLTGHQGPVTSVAFGHDGRLIATASRDNTTRVWDAASGEKLLSLPGHGYGLARAVWHPRELLLATSGLDNQVKIWDMLPDRGPYLLGHDSAITTFAISADRKLLATASLDNSVWVWDAFSGEAHHQYQFDAPVYSIAFRHDRQRLAVAGKDGFAAVLGVPSEDKKPLQLLFSLVDPALGKEKPGKAHADDIRQIAFSEDGEQLATASFDRTVKVWKTPPDEDECTRPDTCGADHTEMWHTDRVFCVAFSPDGKTLATGSQDQTVRVWNLSDPNATPLILSPQAGTVRSVTFRSNDCLATGSDDGYARLWERKGSEWTEYKLEPKHVTSVGQVSFSGDGKYLATASADMTARVWDVKTRKRVHDVGGHDGPVLLVAFSPVEPASSPNKLPLITATLANGVKTGHVYKNKLELEDLLEDAKHPDRYFQEWILKKGSGSN